MSDAPDTTAAITPNFGLNLPDVGGDWDQWGDETNANWQFVDGAMLARTGGTMTGALVLSGDPTTNNGAATKRYVDAALGAGLPDAPNDGRAYGRMNISWVQVLPLAGGTLTGPLVLNADPTAALHPATKQYADTKLPLAGGTLTGTLTLAGDPANPAEASTKRYSDTKLPLAGGTLTGALVLPGNPVSALQASPKQYVDTMLPLAGGTMTGPLALAADPAAPLQPATKQYADALTAGAHNYIINPVMGVNQKGTGAVTAHLAYPLDRWQLQLGADTASAQRIAMTDADRAEIGDEAARAYLRNVFTGSSSAGAYNMVMQTIEGVRRLANKPIVVSFWARATVAGLLLRVVPVQSFGTGGSPSAQVAVTPVNVTLGTTFQRFAVPFTIPSVAGKTLGTNFDDCLQLRFMYSAQTAGMVQSGTVSLTAVKVEIGTTATPLVPPELARELSDCQRYFQYHQSIVCYAANGAAGVAVVGDFMFPVTMRAAPVQTTDTPQLNNATGPTLNLGGFTTHIRMQGNLVAAGQGSVTFNMALNAELT